MNFSETTPIYLQIVEYVCEQIVLQKWKTESRIPSVRELGVALQVNPNTVLRSYDYLQTNQIVINKRGIGYFVTSDAVNRVVTLRKERFFQTEIPNLAKTLKLLNISIEELINAIKDNQ
jgi:DNA-binding transcriptional regulator YhcF (GntR family)